MNKKILVIEDDTSIRESITELLHLEGFEVHSSADGSEGLKQIQKWQPNLVISDIRMPGMNGLEMLELYARNKDHAKIPFLFLSALAGKADVRAGMNLGADDYLTKPFTQAELLGAVELQLAKKQKREV